MIKVRTDLHTHTIASGHAYSTLSEMIDSAAAAGIEMIATTDHAPAMPGSCNEIFFGNLRMLPREVNGVKILRGVELNILDTKGNVDLSKQRTRKLDWVIASIHSNVLAPETGRDYTDLYLSLAKNPLINLIGHPDSPDFPFDIDCVVPAMAEAGKVIEINEHHIFEMSGESLTIARRLAEACERYGAMISVDSDAHTRWSVGATARACAMLDEMNFPEELILNMSAERVLKKLGLCD